MAGGIRTMLLAGLVLLVGACTGGNGDSKKLDDILARLDRIEKKVDTGARPPRPPPPSQPAQDPKTVYSVPIEGDPGSGPKVAKVTIVEASDFA